MIRTRNRSLIRAVFAASSVGIVVGAFMVFIAIEHNPQGEFADQVTGQVRVGASVELFLGWFFLCFLVGILIWGLARGLQLALGKKLSINKDGQNSGRY